MKTVAKRAAPAKCPPITKTPSAEGRVNNLSVMWPRAVERSRRAPQLNSGEWRCACGGGCPRCVNDTDGFISRLDAGLPLDDTSRSFFEPRFGQDFSQV